MPAYRIVSAALIASLLAASGASAELQQIQTCEKSPPVAVAGINPEEAAPLSCEASFTCPSTATTGCDLSLYGRLWGIGNIELSHTGVDQSCQRRGSQAHCTTGGTIHLDPNASASWACIAGTGTVAIRIEFECKAAWLNA